LNSRNWTDDRITYATTTTSNIRSCALTEGDAEGSPAWCARLLIDDGSMRRATTKNNVPQAPSADKEMIASNQGNEYKRQRRRRWNRWIYYALSMLLAAIWGAISVTRLHCIVLL